MKLPEKLANRARLLNLVFLLPALIYAIGCSAGRQLSQTPLVLAEAVTDPFVWFAQGSQTSEAELIYVTDRAVEKESAEGPIYNARRSKSLAYGKCGVEIGKQVPWQRLMEQSTRLRRTISLPLAVKSVQELGRFPETPYLLEASDAGIIENSETVKRVECVAATFKSEIVQRLNATERKEAYIFVHGYNNSFNDAAFTLAEIWHFLGRPGVPIIYTWPAGIGGLRGYTYDRESGEFTNFHLKQFIKLLSEIRELERIHIICHSRGTDVVTTALRELFLEAKASGRDPKQVYRIANLILAAPDMDLEVVTQRVSAERIQMGVGHCTLYVSSTDKALGFSDWLFQGVTRLGRMGESDLTPTMRSNLKTFTGLDIIKVTAKSGYIGHSYFHSNPSVSSDLILLLRDERAAGKEHGRPLRPILEPGFWELCQGYPTHGD